MKVVTNKQKRVRRKSKIGEMISKASNSLHSSRKETSASSSLSMDLLTGRNADTGVPLPYTLTNMRIKSDGGRELSLRSLLSLKNLTKEPLYLSIRRDEFDADFTLQSGHEWHVPVRLAHPNASLLIRRNESADWTEALRSLSALIVQGRWGRPTRLRADVCGCEASDGVSLQDWVILMKPEVRDVRLGIPTKSYLPVKFPSKELNRLVGGAGVYEGEGSMRMSDVGSPTTLSLEDIYQMSLYSSGSHSNQVESMCVQLLAPLQLFSAVCQPLLFRLSDHSGVIVSEGTLLSGEVIDVHALGQLFQERLYLSIRMLNYCWSKWIVIFTRSAPYAASERIESLTLPSMELTYQTSEILLPRLELNLSIREQVVRISCPIMINNRTGMQLDFCDGSSTENFVPLTSKPPAESFVPMGSDDSKEAKSVIFDASTLNAHQRRRNVLLNEFDTDEDDENDDDDSSETSSKSSSRADTDASARSSLLASLHLDVSMDASSFDAMSPKQKRQPPKLSAAYMRLFVHLPGDHFAVTEVMAGTDWLLEDVFNSIAPKLSTSKAHRNLASYIFLSWDSTSLTTNKIINSPAREETSYFGRSKVPGDKEGDPDIAQKVEKKTSIFDTGRLNKKESLFGSTIGSSIDNSTAEVPAHLQFDMLADCSSTPLSMDLKLANLQFSRLRLCHVSEWNLYRQVCAIKCDVKQKEGMTKYLSTPKVHFISPFMRFDGNIPFNPKNSSFISFQQTLSLRVPNQTDWSQAIDLLSSNFGSGSDYVSVSNSQPTDLGGRVAKQSSLDNQYEFGVYAEKGKGFYQNVTSISVVPKYILISKFPITLQLRQMEVDDQYSFINLNPNQVQSFHFPIKSKPRTLQVRRYSETMSVNDKWFGELDISSFGIAYIKLRNPLTIIKAQIAGVGASLATTFSLQDNLWPPYRVDNRTSFNIRFRQSSIAAQAQKSNAPSFVVPNVLMLDNGGPRDSESGVSRSSAAPNSSRGKNLGSDDTIPWDLLSANQQVSYAWDYPKSGRQTLRVEFEQLNNVGDNFSNVTWVGREFPLDTFTNQRNSSANTFTLTKPIASMDQTSAEGYLMVRSEGHTSSDWTQYYGVLQHDVIFLFKDESQTNLMHIINLCRRVYAIQSAHDLLQLGCIEKYQDKKKDFSIPFLSTAQQQKAAKRLDVNRHRILLLRLAEYMGAFDNSKNNEEDTGNGDVSSDSQGHGLQILLPGPQAMNIHDRVYSPRSSVRVSVRGRPVGSGGGYTTLVQSGLTTRLNHRSSLLSQLQSTRFVDQLMDEATTINFNIMDLLEALVAIGEARNDVEAIQLAAVLFEHGMIESFATDIGASSVPLDSNTSPSTSYDKSKRIDGSNSEKSGNRLQSARSVSSDRSATSVASGRSEPVFAELLRACGLDDLMVTSAAKGANDDSTLHALASSLMAIPNMIPNLRLGSGKMKGSSSAEMRRTGRHATVHGEVQTNLRFKMCSLNPEIFETVEQVQQGIGTKFESENNGFSVTLNKSVHHFLCASPQEYMLWIGNCRRNLERLWVKFELGEEIGENLDMHDYKVQVQAKVRADGPTKVLEFIEIGSKKKQKRILLSQSQMTSPMLQALSSTRSPLQKDASGRLASPTGNNVNEDDDDDNYDRMSEEKVTGKGRASNESVESDDDEEPDVTFEYVSDDDDGDGSKPTFPAQAYFFHPDTTFADPHTITSAKVEFVSFSVVDAQPAELIYLSFRDIAVSVERRMPILKLSVTVQSIIGCNQLLNPSYPVLLHPRMSSLIIPPDDVDGGGNLRQGRQLMLPGLIQTGDRYPCLHLYFQQKLRPHETRAAEASKAGGVTENNNADSNPLNLQYFEMVTAWLAPMELNLDDEILIRSVRYLQAVRLSLKRPDLGSQTSMLEDMLAVQHMGTKSWGICDAGVISENYFLFQESARLQYMEYQPLGKEKNFLYFSLLQLHPIDLVMRFRSLTGFSGTTTETAIVSIVSQLDSSRLCLNSFTVEDAFASTSLLADSIAKHYKASLWRQFRKLIGTGDLIEGTSNLTSNLGTGVRDIFYDPIDSLVEENSGTLIDGLSKGGASLASQAIGGAGSAAAKFTGGLGQGVSLLTLDAEFYRARANRRMNKAKTISEGLYVGTKELGKNIAEGVTGIVFAPYRGMQESGASGFATGLAKGILGAALKPAIGVFDFAARTGEGIRNATIGADEIIAAKLDASLARVRIPRHFSSSGTVVPFNNTSAAAQYMADKLTGFQSQNRPLIVFHQHLMRRLGEVGASSPFKLPAGYHPRQKNIRNTRRSDRSDMGDSIASMASLADTTDAGADEVVNQRSRLSAADFVDAEVDPDVLAELTGLDKVESAESANQRLSVDSVSSQRLRQSTTTRKGASSLRKELGLDELKQSPNESWGMCVGRSYVVLVSAGCIMLAQIQSRKPSAGFIDPTSSNTAGKPTVKSGEFKLIWSCPTAAVGELFSDSAGDLVLSMELPVTLAGNWNSLFPVIHDKLAQDFLIFQLFLEQTLGLALARLQPLQPMHGLLEGGLYKGYNNTMKSMMLNPTKHIFQLYGYVLYEYSTHKKTTLSQTMEYVNGPGDAKPSEVGTSQHKKDGDENVTEMVRQIFSPTGDNKNKLEERFVIPETEFLSCIYPLVDVKVDGPYSEESGKFSVTVKPKVEGGKLKILKREAESSLFQENVKSQVTILFPTREIAMNWRFALDERIARQPVDVISSPVQSELLRKYSGMQSTVTQTLRQVNAAIKSTIGSGGELEGDIEPNTIAGMLVIPTSGEKVEVSEALKIEIANVLRPTYDDK